MKRNKPFMQGLGAPSPHIEIDGIAESVGLCVLCQCQHQLGIEQSCNNDGYLSHSTSSTQSTNIIRQLKVMLDNAFSLNYPPLHCPHWLLSAAPRTARLAPSVVVGNVRVSITGRLHTTCKASVITTFRS